MALSAKNKSRLNDLWKYVPGYRAEGESKKPALGDLMAAVELVPVAFVKETVPAAAATTVVTVTGAKVGDKVIAIIAKPNTGASIATAMRSSVTADNQVTLTPNVTPTTADGMVDIVVYRSVAAEK